MAAGPNAGPGAAQASHVLQAPACGRAVLSCTEAAVPGARGSGAERGAGREHGAGVRVMAVAQRRTCVGP